MSTLATAQQTTILRRLGWRVRTSGERVQALKHFQDGWNLGPKLTANGACDTATSNALLVSEGRRQRGLPTASAHFSFAEFACGCKGRYSNCPRIWTKRALLEALEVLRAKDYPRGITIISGCRCASHNKAVGGARNSQHLYGAAADVPYAASWRSVRGLRQFAGIGRSGRTGMVRHVDRRDVSGANTTNGSRTTPTVWNYAN